MLSPLYIGTAGQGYSSTPGQNPSRRELQGTRWLQSACLEQAVDLPAQWKDPSTQPLCNPGSASEQLSASEQSRRSLEP